MLFTSVSPAILAGCEFLGRNSSSETRRTSIDLDNYWVFLNINIVNVGPGRGTRLQIFPQIEGEFQNVVISYSLIEEGEAVNRVLLLSTYGRGETSACASIFPIINDVNGIVEYNVV